MRRNVAPILTHGRTLEISGPIVLENFCVSDNAELVIEGRHEPKEVRADKDHEVANGAETGHLSERQFDQLTEKLIYVATANSILPSDALAALAKALGTLSTFTARREGCSVEEVLSVSQDTVVTFARAAEIYMNENPDVDQSKP
jgi:hypothetical protein